MLYGFVFPNMWSSYLDVNKMKDKIPNKYFIECIQNPLAFPPPPNPNLFQKYRVYPRQEVKNFGKDPRAGDSLFLQI